MRIIPAYIVLHITKIGIPDQRQRGAMAYTVLTPRVRKLYPMPVNLSENPQSGKAEIDTGNAVFCFAEAFDDVVRAIEEAFSDELPIIRVPLIGDISDAVKSITSSFPMPWKAGEAMKGGALSDVPPVATGGEAEPVDVSRLEDGDLQISEASAQDGPVWIVLRRHNGEWSRDAAPIELREHYLTREAAIDAIKLAGYLRRLKSICGKRPLEKDDKGE
jgi:hypothetical protein